MRLIIFFTTRSAQFDRHTSGRREGDSHGYENLFHGNGVEAPVPSGGESPPVRGLFTTSREITVRARLRGGGSGTAKQLSPVSDPSQFLAYPRNCNQILVASLPSRVSARLRLLIQQCSLSGVKRTSCRCAVMSADDPYQTSLRLRLLPCNLVTGPHFASRKSLL